MTPEKVTHFKKRLEKERELLEEELTSLGWKDASTKEWVATPGSFDPSATEQDELADRMEQQEENAEEILGLEPRLQDVKDALDKIEKGTYGLCENEGDPIEEARLEANPAARTCMAHTR